MPQVAHNQHFQVAYRGGGGGSTGPPAISKTLGPMNLKFFKISETFLNVSEYKSCLLSVYLVTIATPQRIGASSGKSLDFSRKYQLFKFLPNRQS